MFTKTFSRIIPFLLITSIVLAACSQEGAQDTSEATPGADVTPVTQASDSGVITAEGQLIPLDSVDLSFQLGGTVTEVLATEGQAVAAGEPIIRLDATALEAALAQANAGLAAANAGLAAAQAQASVAASQQNTAAAGLVAAEAQLALVQAGPRPEQIAAAEQGVAAAEAGVAQAAARRDEALNVSEAQVRSAEAQLAAAQSQLTALQDTYDTIVTTCVALPDGGEVCPLLGAPEETVRAQVEAAEARYSAAQLALDEARAGATAAEQQSAVAGVGVASAQQEVAEAQLALLNAGARPEQVRLAEIGVEQARVAMTRADVAATQAAAAVAQAEASVQSAQTGVNQAQVALDRMTLTTPFAGTVGEVLVEEGELVGPGVPVARLANIDSWLVDTTDLVELDVVNITVGQPAEVTLDAIPGETLRGTVTQIGLVPELTRGDVTYQVRIALDDYPDLPLRWGMTALVNMDARSSG